MANQIEASANLTNANQEVVVPGVDLSAVGIAAGNGLYIVGQQARYQVAAPPTFDGTDTTIVLTGTYAGATASAVEIVIQTGYTTLGLPRLSVVARNGGAIMAYLADKLDALLQGIINGTQALTSPDINGGTADSLTSLTVAADSDGNVSRWVMDTSAANSQNYWAKIATFTNTLGSTNSLGKTLILQYANGRSGGTVKESGYTSITIDIRDDVTSGFLAGSSAIYVNQACPVINYNGFMLVGSATLGQPIELWAQIATANIGRELSVFDISGAALLGNDANWTIAYNAGATWTATTPTGAVTITSDWAGSGRLTSTSFSNGWAGTAYYEKSADGWVSFSAYLTTVGTTTDATTIFTMPAGYRPSVREVTHIKANGSVSGGVACGIEIREDTGAVNLAGAYVSGGTFLRLSAKYRARS